ncbi:MAG: PAS domain-containing sensor histidine kinase [Alphaproteobacteria bacterium]|nr:PAS domain-containing sensor histidine kinase [Alphaproteobacteria bacterium]
MSENDGQAGAGALGEGNLRLLHQLLGACPVAISIVGPDRLRRYVNQQYADLMRAPVADFIGALADDSYVDAKDRDRALALFAKEGRVQVFEARRKRMDGSHFWGLVSIEPIIYEGEECLAGWLYDITARKEAEEHRLEQHKKLESLNRTANTLLSVIGHDLRQPFNALIGFSQLLETHVDNNNHEKIIEYAGLISQAALNGHGLLEQILDWSSREGQAWTPRPEDVDLANLIDGTLALVEPMARRKGVALARGALPTQYVRVDQHMTNTILRNLITNGIKYSSRGGKVAVDGRLLRQAGRATELCLNIADNGVGMTVEQIDGLFQSDLAVTTDGTSGETGLGLGLLLCKELVELQGGHIWAECTPDQGSTFSFTVPLSTA